MFFSLFFLSLCFLLLYLSLKCVYIFCSCWCALLLDCCWLPFLLRLSFSLNLSLFLPFRFVSGYLVGFCLNKKTWVFIAFTYSALRWTFAKIVIKAQMLWKICYMKTHSTTNTSFFSIFLSVHMYVRYLFCIWCLNSVYHESSNEIPLFYKSKRHKQNKRGRRVNRKRSNKRMKKKNSPKENEDFSSFFSLSFMLKSSFDINCFCCLILLQFFLLEKTTPKNHTQMVSQLQGEFMAPCIIYIYIRHNE